MTARSRRRSRPASISPTWSSPLATPNRRQCRSSPPKPSMKPVSSTASWRASIISSAEVKRGRFISLEGGEGVGKSTQLKRPAETLRSRGLDAAENREPRWERGGGGKGGVRKWRFGGWLEQEKK